MEQGTPSHNSKKSNDNKSHNRHNSDIVARAIIAILIISRIKTIGLL